MARENIDDLLDDLMDTPRRAAHGTVTGVGRQTIHHISQLGGFMQYLLEVLIQTFTPPFRTRLVFQQLEFIGNQSLSIILLTALAIGAVFSLLTGVIFRIFQAEAMTGATTALAFSREMAPMMVSFLMAGRAGSSMTAEIATMRVNEQIDAMEAIGVNPIHYLVVPRFLASIIVAPFLCGTFLFLSMLGALMMATAQFQVDQGVFFERIRVLTDPEDILMGLEKSVVFAAVVTTIACRYGLKASGGAKGVGVATTDGVVASLLTLLVFDFIITYIQIVFFK